MIINRPPDDNVNSPNFELQPKDKEKKTTSFNGFSGAPKSPDKADGQINNQFFEITKQSSFNQLHYKATCTWIKPEVGTNRETTPLTKSTTMHKPSNRDENPKDSAQQSDKDSITKSLENSTTEQSSPQAPPDEDIINYDEEPTDNIKSNLINDQKKAVQETEQPTEVINTPEDDNPQNPETPNTSDSEVSQVIDHKTPESEKLQNDETLKPLKSEKLLEREILKTSKKKLQNSGTVKTPKSEQFQNIETSTPPSLKDAIQMRKQLSDGFMTSQYSLKNDEVSVTEHKQALPGLGVVKQKLHEKLTDITSKYPQVTLGSGRTYTYASAVASIKNDLANSLITKEQANQRLEDLKKDLMGAKDPDGKPLSEEQIQKMIDETETIFREYIDIHFQIKEHEAAIEKAENDKEQALNGVSHELQPGEHIPKQIKLLNEISSTLDDQINSKELPRFSFFENLLNRIENRNNITQAWIKGMEEIREIIRQILHETLAEEVVENQIEFIQGKFNTLEKMIESRENEYTPEEFKEIRSKFDSIRGSLKTWISIIQIDKAAIRRNMT